MGSFVAVTFHSLHQELDRWFLSDSTVRTIKGKADDLMRQRFKDAYQPTKAEENEEQKFYQLLTKKWKKQASDQTITTTQRIAIETNLQQCERDANGFIDSYSKDPYLGLKYWDIKKRTVQACEAAERAEKAAFDVFHTLGKDFLVAYGSLRTRVDQMYTEAVSQKKRAQSLLKKLERRSLDQAAEDRKAALLASDPGVAGNIKNEVVGTLKSAYRLVRHPTQIPSAIKRNPGKCISAVALAAGWYLGWFGWVTLITSGIGSVRSYNGNTYT